jgi:hypothetical protein
LSAAERLVVCDLRRIGSPREVVKERMISEAAYYLAQKRGFRGESTLDDWLAAEQEIRQVISPSSSGRA